MRTSDEGRKAHDIEWILFLFYNIIEVLLLCMPLSRDFLTLLLSNHPFIGAMTDLNVEYCTTSPSNLDEVICLLTNRVDRMPTAC